MQFFATSFSFFHFVKAHSVLSKSQTECVLFWKTFSLFKKKIVSDILNFFFDDVSWKITSIFLISFCKEKVHVSDSHLAFPAWRVVFQKTSEDKKCNHASKTQYFCWTQWVVSEWKGRFFPSPPTHPHTHTFKALAYAQIHTCSETETYTH